MTLAEPISVTLELTAGLEDLGLDYVIGGSIASSLHGVPRATQDIDVLVVLWGKDVEAFVARFESDFYVDRDMVIEAIKRRASFNIIHLATMYKVDVFVADWGDLTREELNRKQSVELGEPSRSVWVCSAEDIILQKLRSPQTQGASSRPRRPKRSGTPQGLATAAAEAREHPFSGGGCTRMHRQRNGDIPTR